MNFDFFKAQKTPGGKSEPKNVLSREEGAPESISHFLQQAAVFSQGTTVTVDGAGVKHTSHQWQQEREAQFYKECKGQRKKKEPTKKTKSDENNFSMPHGKSVVWA